MAATVRGGIGTLATIMSTELNSLANNARVVSSVITCASGNGSATTTGVYNNLAGSGASATSGDGYQRAIITLNLGGVMPGTPTVPSSVDVYFLASTDGGNTFGAGSSSLTPPHPPAVSLGLSASTAIADNRDPRECFIPVLPFKILVINNGSGQALPSSGNTITLLPVTDQVS